VRHATLTPFASSISNLLERLFSKSARRTKSSHAFGERAMRSARRPSSSAVRNYRLIVTAR
jgi:hypothetical protein